MRCPGCLPLGAMLGHELFKLIMNGPSGLRQGFTFSLNSEPVPEIKRKVEERVAGTFHHTSTGQQAFRWWLWSVRDGQE